MANNSVLGSAKAAKNDEFYTQLPDIEHEMQSYVDWTPDAKKARYGIEPTLFDAEASSPSYDPDKWRIFVLDRDLNGDRRVDFDDLRWNTSTATGTSAPRR